MIPMFNKDGKQCMAENDQVAAMEAGGWSRKKPADKPAADASGSNNANAKPAAAKPAAPTAK